jgi:hypothetical protein
LVEPTELAEHERAVADGHNLAAAEQGSDDVRIGIEPPGGLLVAEFGRVPDVNRPRVQVLPFVARRRHQLLQRVEGVLQDVRMYCMSQ